MKSSAQDASTSNPNASFASFCCNGAPAENSVKKLKDLAACKLKRLTPPPHILFLLFIPRRRNIARVKDTGNECVATRLISIIGQKVLVCPGETQRKLFGPSREGAGTLP